MSFERRLDEAIQGEQLARIAYRMIERQYRYLRYDPALASEYIFTLASWTNATLTQELELYIAAYGYHVKKGHLTKFIRAMFIQRAVAGYTHRQILLWSYKAPWISAPPVSNTGGTSPTTTKGGSAL